MSLDSMHRKCIAHMDVKPSNIAIDIDGNFIFLIDLGSVQVFGQFTHSTHKYLPYELRLFGCANGEISTSTTDFWMLAVTLYTKIFFDGDIVDESIS